MTPPSASASPLARPAVAALHAYVPGEQPKDPQLIKLNTNENNYAPAPGVLAAIAGLAEGALRRYPDPNAERLRAAIAADLGVGADQVIAGNGSDELLKMVAEVYADPADKVAYLWPTYSLYPLFVAKAMATEVRLAWSVNGPSPEAALASLPVEARVLYLANPNPPFGTLLDLDAIRRVARRHPDTVVVVDEAYVAYAGDDASAVALVREGFPNVLVTRTFSKSHSLAGMRVGFAIGAAAMVADLFKVKDSYNLDAVSQALALASWQDHDYTCAIVERICATRQRLAAELTRRGFAVVPSHGNFLFARRADATEVFRRLRERHILVRYFDTPELRDGIRISIGTDAEIDALLAAL